MVEEHGNGASHSWDVVLDMNVKGRRLRLGCWLVFFGGDHFVAEAVVGCGGESRRKGKQRLRFRRGKEG